MSSLPPFSFSTFNVGNAEYVEDKTQVIEVTEAALADVHQLWADNEEEDVAEAKDRTAPQPEAVTVSEIVLEEDTVHTETAVAEPSTELTLAEQAEAVAVVEDVTFVSSEGPVSSDETVASELQETPRPEASCDVTIPPEDTRASEPVEAPVIRDEAAESTPEVASLDGTTTASEAPLESLESGKVALASQSEDAAACEVSGPSESALLREARVLDDDASKGEGDDVALMEAQVSVETLEQCETIAPRETEVQYSVAPQEVTSPAATIAEDPVNWEASEHAEVETTPESPPTCPITEDSKADIRSSDEEKTEEHAIIAEVERPEETPSLKEPNAAPEEECEAADLDLVEDVPASLPIPSQTSSEEDPTPQAETMSSESLAESAAQGEGPAIEPVPADLGTVSIFR